MVKVGLTGGIGSGKSTVSRMLKERGFYIVDADIVAREVLEKYPEILEKVKLRFGEEYFDESGKLKRKKFGNLIFSKEEKRKDYEDIIIPFIRTEIFNRIEELEKKEIKACILDAATLIENGFHKYMDVNILVWVDQATQMERVKRRDNLSEAQVINRINSQMTLEDKKKAVNYIVNNSESIERTEEELDKVLKQIGL